MNPTQQPRLAAPGAGLPSFELFIARILFALGTRTGSRGAFISKFETERSMIADLVQRCHEGEAGERILIRRARGMEDSSRNWSVWMTLDHLRIVHESVAGVIRSLSENIVPEKKVSTADVKPSPEVNGDVVAVYESSCDSLLKTVVSISDLKTPARYNHPWFGPMNAFEWTGPAGAHMGIHRVQIERILQGLGHSRV